MKKQITLAVLGLLTLAGGSWLAAQQRDPLLATSPAEAAPPSDPIEVFEARAGEDPAVPRRPTATSPKRATSGRQTQDMRGAAVEVFREDAARFPNLARSFNQFQATGPGQLAFGTPVRMTPEDAARMRAFQDAIRELREAEGAEEKANAREQVTKLVSEQLDADLENRETELAAIEQRAKELRKQLEERKTAKPELLKMLVMLIDNPQVGLGIPPEWMQMLMRGQPDRYRQGFPGLPFAEPVYPVAPPRPAEPPAADAVSRQDEVDENASEAFLLKRDERTKASRNR